MTPIQSGPPNDPERHRPSGVPGPAPRLERRTHPAGPGPLRGRPPRRGRRPAPGRPARRL